MRTAIVLPHYRKDWLAALGEVQPGFNILSDMQVVNRYGNLLQTEFQAVERLIVAHGVSVLAEIHVPGLPTRTSSDVVTTSKAMQVRQFLDIWEASHFLDGLHITSPFLAV